MPVEFIGFVSSQNHSEIIPPTGPVIDVSHIETAAKIHENGGFDRVLVASPGFLETHPVPTHPNDLIGLSPIVYTYGSQEPDWTFRKGNQQICLPMHSSFATNNSEVVHRALVEGMGVGLMPEFSVSRELKSGRLVRLMPEWTIPQLDLHIVYPGPQNACLRRRTVLNFLLSLAPDLAGELAPMETMVQ